MRIFWNKHVSRTFTALVMTVLVSYPAFAADETCSGCRMAADRELAEICGGYSADDGLEVTFGITKSVLVNGVLQTENTLNLRQAGMPLGQGAQNQVVNLIQSGTGNAVSSSVLSGLGKGVFTFVQNNLDKAVVQNVTKIDASVTVLNLYRNMNLGSMLNRQVINSLR